jgi:hypothetical protein
MEIRKSNWPVGSVLAAAKHRFCSYSMPLGRFCLHLPEMLTTINKISAGGSSWAKQWLDKVSATDILVLAMMADMSRAAIDLCRYFDKETMDIATINQHVSIFVSEITCLFDQGKCFELECFTKTCLEALRSQNLLVVFGDGHARGLKPFAQDCADALARLRACCVVTRKAVQAEFPDVDAMMAFKAFHVGVPGTCSQEQLQGLQRLSKLWGLDYAETLAEFQMVLRIAQAHQKESGCSNKDAWQWAMRRTAKTKWPVKNLEKVGTVTGVICLSNLLK